MRGSFQAADNILTLFLITLGKYLLFILLGVFVVNGELNFWDLIISFFIVLFSASIFYYRLFKEFRLRYRALKLYRKDMPLIVYDENVIHIRPHRVFLSWGDIQKVELMEKKNTLLFHESTSSKIHEIDMVYFQEPSEKIYLQIRTCHLSAIGKL